MGLSPAFAMAQETFGVEIATGQSRGLTSYRQDVIYTQPRSVGRTGEQSERLVDLFLADEIAGWGPHLALRLRIDSFGFGVHAQWHNRDEIELHHQSSAPASEGRARPDGTYDDSGIEYIELEQPEVIASQQRNRGALFVATAQGIWRPDALKIERGALTLALPISGGISMVHVSEPNLPYVFGLSASVSAEAMYELSSSFSLFGAFRTSALATVEYNRLEEAMRRSSLTGRSTAAGFLSTLAQATLEVGAIFWVR